MKPDILFWFYKEFDICKDRLQVARQHNPEVRVYALYGGPICEADTAHAKLGYLLDDFWVFPEDKDKKWKWRNGDLMIAQWFRDRGCTLAWDTIFVMQWDMLVVSSLDRLFHMLQPGHILLSGFRPLDEVAAEWWWANPNVSETATELLKFKNLLSERYNYRHSLSACLFVVACLPRVFLQRYVEAGPPEVGFMEYKIPTFATVFQIPVCKSHPFVPAGWNPRASLAELSGSRLFLSAIGNAPPLSLVFKELQKEGGYRLFHPVRVVVKPWMLKQHNLWWLRRTFTLIEKLVSVKARLAKIYRKIVGKENP